MAKGKKDTSESEPFVYLLIGLWSPYKKKPKKHQQQELMTGLHECVDVAPSL